jgi:hypothetical protein
MDPNATFLDFGHTPQGLASGSTSGNDEEREQAFG